MNAQKFIVFVGPVQWVFELLSDSRTSVTPGRRYDVESVCTPHTMPP